MATNQAPSSNLQAEKMGGVLDALSNGIAKTAANEPKFEPQMLVPEVPAEPARQLLTEIMLAARWRIQSTKRWRAVAGCRMSFCSAPLLTQLMRAHWKASRPLTHA